MAGEEMLTLDSGVANVFACCIYSARIDMIGDEQTKLK